MYNTSASWKEQIYTNKQCIMNVYFDNVLINSDYILDFKKGGEIFDEEFSLEIATSQYIELKILKDQIATMPEVIRVEFGILLNNNSNTTEIIPIGIYNLESYTDNDDGTLTIKALDNMIKFEFNYDGSTLVNTNGSATLLQVVQDICNQAGVELGSTSFLNSDKQIAVYDNSVSAREYIKYIAESSGGFACIGRDGKLYFKDIYQDTAQISIDMFGTYKWSEEFKISKVHYEDGVRNFTFGDSTRNTLYINQDNMFIVSQAQVQNIFNKVKNLTINSFEGQTIIDPAIDLGDKIIIDGKPVVFQGEIALAGSFIADIKCNIQTKQKEETTVITPSQVAINRRVQGQIDQVEGRITQLVEETSENTQNISLHEQTINGITNTVSSVETKVNNIQVGGRNYLKNSKTIVTIAKPSNNYNQYSWDSYHPLAGKTLSNELTFTLSFRFIPEDEGYKPCTSIVVGKSQNGDIWSKRLYPNNFNVKKYSDYYFYYASFKIPATEGAYIQSFVKFILSSSDSNNIGGQISHLKLEDGNIPTDWTPAPEDIDSNLENNYYTKTQTESKIDQKADEITSTVTSIETKVNNLQIGGTNILRGTDVVTALTSSGTWANGTWRSATSGNGTRERIDIIDSPNANIKKGWRFTRTAENNSSSVDVAQDSVPVANGQTYTMSCWVRNVSGNTRLRLQYGKNPYRNNQPLVTNTSWKKYTYTFTVGEQSDGSTNGSTNIYFGLFQDSVGVLEICGLKLESGNKATDWSPAPEDIESNLQNNYYTKTETESKIEQKADSITSTVSQNYSTKAETTQAKNEAINSANTSTDNKLANYSTTTQMNSAITQKANEITSTVTTLENKVNNMQVGGRNYILNSAFQKGKVTRESGAAGWQFTNLNTLSTTVKHNGHNSMLCKRENQSSDSWKETSYIYYRDLTQINNSEEKWTLSFWLYSDDATWTEDTTNNIFVSIVRVNNGSTQVAQISLPRISDVLRGNGGKWIKYVATFSINVDYTHFGIVLSPKRNCNCYYTDFKLEKGNVATDWTPAPEDIESNLEDNYYTKTETESKIQQKADEITSTVSTVETKLNNLQVGGTNLLRGTNIITSLTNQGTWANGTWRSAGGGTGTRTSISVSDAPNANIKVGWSTTSTSGQVLIAQDNVPMTNGEQYTISCYAKGTGKIYMQYGNGTVGYFGSVGDKYSITDSNNWKKFSYTFTSKGTANIYIGSDSAGNDVSFCGIKLEKGNIATDWSPAPEDIESNLTANYYTKTETETKIDQKADNITSTVNRTISNIQTGTENLLLNTAIKENTNNWTLVSGITRTTSKTTPNGNYCFYYNISGLTSNSWRCANPAYVSVQPGEILTADVNVFIPSSNDIDGEVALEIQYFNSSRTRIGYLKKLIDTTVVDKWQKATVTLEAPTNAAYANARVWVLKNGKFYVGDLILSRGNTSASWAPSSNDYTAKTELGTLIEQNWEHIKVAWNQISQYLQLEGTNGSASLNIYNQSNNKLMTLNANGETYYNGSGNEIGKIGIIRQNNKDILAFSMPVDWNNISSSRSMAWGIFDPNNNFLPIFYLAGLYGANNSEYEGQLVVAGGLSAQDIELEQGIIKASIGGFQVLNNNDQVMLSVLKNGSGSSTYFNLLDLISTWYNTTVGCHYLDFHNNRLANLGNVPVSETNDPNLIKVINNIGGFDDSYIYASFKNGGDVFVYSNSSDRNLKKNIKETNISAIELIQKINHVQFDWKSNERHQSIGYIAQEMQEVEESFVHHSKYKDKEDWQINTLSVLATATKAIQEQQEIIEDLKSRIEKLEKKVNK